MAFDASDEGAENTGSSEVAEWFKAQKLGSIVPALVEKGWDDMYVFYPCT